MATFDATKSGTTANSYATVDEADEYHELDFASEEWSSIGDEIKEKLLITATRQIDRFTAAFDKLDSTQALKFPMDVEGLDIGDGFEQANEACIRQALYVYQNQDSVNEGRGGIIQGVKSEAIGPMSKSFTGFNPFGKWFPGLLALLADWIDLEIKTYRA